MHILTAKFRVLLLAAVVLSVVILLAAGSLIFFSDSGELPVVRTKPPNAVPLAILGDSDSHSFQDTFTYPPDSGERGGKYRAITFNWPEILDRLRGDELDLGEWRLWGPSKPIAKARELLGLPVRRPRKEDYRHNFAINGAGCKDLNTGWRQVDRLRAVIALDPAYWERGIVVIRIGVNSFAQTPNLDVLAVDPLAPDQHKSMTECVDAIANAITRLRSLAPSLRFVVVGIFNNAHWAKRLDRWQSTQELSNISAGLDQFDSALQTMAAADARVAFFDDRAFFRTHWGSRDSQGKPAYTEVVLPGGFTIENTAGDHPSNAVLGDGHAGTVWNALWCSSLLELLNREFDMSLTPLREREIQDFLSRAARNAGIEL